MTGDEVTIADIGIAVSLTMPTIVNADYSKYEKLSAWLGRMHATAEWKQVDEKFQPGRKEIMAKIAEKKE